MIGTRPSSSSNPPFQPFLFVCLAPSPEPSSSNYFASCAFPFCLSLRLPVYARSLHVFASLWTRLNKTSSTQRQKTSCREVTFWPADAALGTQQLTSSSALCHPSPDSTPTKAISLTFTLSLSACVALSLSCQSATQGGGDAGPI
ncbi:hypothetical protein CCMA1212_001287 [Trichoderma ghanense]|uniref:Uncharacterized protein n=1 Tax=Trichoderma ghanense TaxID=65468 RepID=A0ABY2HIS6_9HYPO